MLRPLLTLLCLSVSQPVLAQSLSAPQPAPFPSAFPVPQDTPYPGTIDLKVDATDTARGIFRVQQTIPVAKAGPMTLLMPQWLPGNHAPRGQIDKLVGLTIKAGGKTLAWRRDPVDVYAFHVDVPEGAPSLDIGFQFVSATDPSQGRVVMTGAMLNLQWEAMSLYPAGYFTRQIPVRASVTYPQGWRAATALRGTTAGDTVTYEPVSYDVLVDSPVFAGCHFRAEDLGQGFTLNIVADDARFLDAKPAQIDAHKRLVDQALKLFGSRPFDHYDFLLSLSDEMGGIGLEHHRSSENGVPPWYFTEWASGPGRRSLLPHELTHSWNGKYRRPADLWTPDYKTPMRDSLLWVYEGQTQFWGYVLSARSGLYSKQETLDTLAMIAATLDTRKGRTWRPLQDTTNDPIISARRPKPWVSWQRSEDYYNEGMLVWLEADSIIREKSGGKKGLDDFARTFFAARDGDYGQRPYDFDEVVATLNSIQPHDWAAFLKARLDQTSDRAPLAGFGASGYKLVYTDEATPSFKDVEKRNRVTDLSYSGGLVVGSGDEISTVLWDSAAFNAGLTIGMKLLAVNGVAYSTDELTAAIKAAKGGSAPIKLLVKAKKRIFEVDLHWHEGLRYPRFEKTAKADGPLDKLLQPRL